MGKEKKDLTLIVKKKWFDMYQTDKKREDYREYNDYWKARLMAKDGIFQKFDKVIIKNGYAKNAPTLVYKHIGTWIGIGKKELGAPDEDCFIIKMK